MSGAVNFRFDPGPHEYTDLTTGIVYPHITGMLEATGWIDDRWYTEESSERGEEVHRLTRDYDLGALDPATCVSAFRGYLLGHVAAMSTLRPTWLAIEEPYVHPTLGFAGRADRELIADRAKSILEIKSGLEEKSHPIQTALQAILVAPRLGLPPEMIQRLILYLKPRGKFKLLPHDNRHDFDRARDIIRRCT